MEVYNAINAVQSEMSQVGISKDKKNVQQGYNFRGIDDVYGALAPMLAKHKLCIIPYVLARSVVERQTKSGGVLFYTTVECEFHFISAVDGSKHIAKTFGEAMDSGDKSTNKAMSAAYKYAAFQTFCIPVDVVDADAETHKDILPKKAKKEVDEQPNDVPEATGHPPEENPPQANVASQNAKSSLISDKQRKRFYTSAKESGKTDEEIKAFLREITGSESTRDIQKGIYDYLCNEVVKAKKEEPAAAVPDPAPAEMVPAPCPDNPGAIYTREHCEKCDKRQGCPAWV
jgi:hypothetical protein